MRRLPLYPNGAPRAGIEMIDPVPINHDCERCPLSEHARTVCMSPGGRKRSGSTSTLLVLGDFPSKAEDASGRPMMSRAGQLIINAVNRWWPGSVVYDNMVKCNPGKKKLPTGSVAACAPYSRHVIDLVQPDRIIASGSQAIKGLLGRSVPPMSVRKGYSWLSDGTPIFLMMPAGPPSRNKYIRSEFDEDMEWALKVDSKRLWLDMPWVVDAQALFVESEEDAIHAVERLRSANLVGFDTETMGHMYADMKVLTTACAVDTIDDVYVWEEEAMDDPTLAKPLLDMLADPVVPKLAHNEIWDRQAIYDVHNVDTENMHADTSVWCKIIDPEAQKRLDYQQNLVGMGGGKDMSKIEQARIFSGARVNKKGWDQIDIDDHLMERFGKEALPVARKVQAAKDIDAAKSYVFGLYDPEIRGVYCAIDALSTVRLGELQEPMIFDSPERTTVWSELMGPGQDAFIHLQRWGCPAHQPTIQKLTEDLSFQLADVTERMRDEFGSKFNPNSPKQVGEILYEDLGFRMVDKTDTGKGKTDEGTLKKLQARKKHWFLDAMLEQRSIHKLLAYPKGWPAYIRDDGRFHPEYKIDGARSGRPSCTDPNLFNVPRADTVNGKICRDCIKVDVAGDFLFQRDLSQAEFRVLCALSGDENMLEAFVSGEDFHTRTAMLIAKQMWGVKDWHALDKGTQKKYRSQTKAVNFGLVYGKTVRTLAKDMGISVPEAQKVVDQVLGGYPKVKKWMQNQLRYAKKHGGVWTEWPIGTDARWRPLPDLGSPLDGRRITAENGAVNSPVQGTASDICLVGLARLVHWIRSNNLPVRIVLTVYDSIIFQVPAALVAKVYWASKRIMEGFDLRGTPLVSDPEIGTSLGTLFNMRDDGTAIYVKQDGAEIDLIEWMKNAA